MISTSLLLQLLTFCHFATDAVVAFSTPVPSTSSALHIRVPRGEGVALAFTQSQRTHTTRNYASKEDEIAALEEKLRKLREDTSSDDSDVAPTASSSASTSSSYSEVNGDIETPPPSASTAVIEEPFSEMLSESWKDSEAAENDDDGGVVKNLLSALAVVAALIIFSQVPVGQDGLDKYSTAKPSTTIDLGDLNQSRSSTSF